MDTESRAFSAMALLGLQPSTAFKRGLSASGIERGQCSWPLELKGALEKDLGTLDM